MNGIWEPGSRQGVVSPWAIPIARITRHPGESRVIDAIFPAPSGIGDAVIRVREGSGVHVSGSFDAIAGGLVFAAHITATVNAVCSRCLTPINRDWQVDASAYFPYESGEARRLRLTADRHGRDRRDGSGGDAFSSRYDDDLGEETEIIPEEDESGSTYPLSPDGSFADIESLLRDELVESLPLQPLCKPDCRGLCPQCGVNLNEHPDHHHDVTDIRWAALKGLKRDLERGTRGSDSDSQHP